MPAYQLPADTNMTAIADGRRCILLAEPRDPNRANGHPGPGARLYFTAAGTKARPRRSAPTVRCAFVADVHMSSQGIVRVTGQQRTAPGRTHTSGPAAIRRSDLIDRLLLQLEQGSSATPEDRARHLQTFATAAGFRDYPALWAGIGGRGGEIVVKTLLAWSLIEGQGEQAEAA